MAYVSVIIPTYNGLELLVAALECLTRQTWREFEVIVVDNDSTDGTIEVLARRFPDVRLVSLSSNRGFAAAVNSGIAAATGDIVVLLNNDTEPDPEWLAALVRAMEDHPEVGFCASKMLQLRAPHLIDSAGDQLGLFASQVGHGAPDGPAFAVERYVFSACAGAAAYRRSMLEDIGLFEERYFAYFEDVDLACRANLAGYRGLYVPDAVVLHWGSATANRMAERKFYLLMRNSLVLFFQYAPPRRLLWAPLVLVWPFICALSERKSVKLAGSAVRDFWRQRHQVLERRSVTRSTRQISWREFSARLAPPLTMAISDRAPATFAGRLILRLHRLFQPTTHFGESNVSRR